MTITAGKPKILYIEGHAILRSVYAQQLNLSAEFEVEVARNGQEGIEKAQAWQPDLILMGLRLPVMDGFETIAAMRRLPALAQVPIVVLSAWNTARHRQRAQRAGANAHLSPPIAADELVNTIKKFLGAAARRPTAS